MNKLHKPHEIMCYAAIAAAVPLLAKFVEVASGSELHPTIWHITWLICGISLVVVCSCLVYIFVAIPLEAVLKRTMKSKVSSERQQKEVADDKEPAVTVSSENEVDSNIQESGQQPDERHQIFQPYVAVDENDRPVVPVLDILDRIFKEIKTKKDVGIALYCVHDLKWLASYPTYNDMVAVFGTDIVGSKSNYSTYMALVRQTTDDYSNATSEFLTDVRAMKPKLRRIEEGMR